ncbi:MAG: ABC transporter permease, partial [Woeseiales bacterium]
MKLELPHTTEGWLVVVIGVLVVFLSLTTDTFLTLTNVFDLLNQISLNVILAVGLLVVLIAGGIDISFAVAASVVQYLVAVTLIDLGGGNWAAGFLLSALFGFLLGAFNAFLIHLFRIISIVVTIATFNIYFGTLMFFTRGVSIYNLPDWWIDRVVLFEVETASGYA